jgi:hypothetical protein
MRIGCSVFLLFARLQYSLRNRITRNKGQKPWVTGKTSPETCLRDQVHNALLLCKSVWVDRKIRENQGKTSISSRHSKPLSSSCGIKPNTIIKISYFKYLEGLQSCFRSKVPIRLATKNILYCVEFWESPTFRRNCIASIFRMKNKIISGFWFLLGSFFNHEDKGDMFVRNVGYSPTYKESQHRSPYFSNTLLPEKLAVAQFVIGVYWTWRSTANLNRARHCIIPEPVESSAHCLTLFL